MTFLNHLKLVEYTGWVESADHWLTRLEFAPVSHGFIFNAAGYAGRVNAIKKVSALHLPNWNGGKPSIRDEDWGAACTRSDDDGEALLVLRTDDLDQACIAAFATSDTFWIKLVLEMRK